MRQIRFIRNPRPRSIELDPVFDVVAPRIRRATIVSAVALVVAGVPFALVGGIAVGAHGYPRATKDVDYLVGEEAFRHHGGGLVTMRSDIPVAVGDVPVDLLSAVGADGFLREAIDRAIIDSDYSIPIIPIGALIYLKLRSPRARDRRDVEALLETGIDTDVVLAYLEEHAPDLAETFAEMVEQAD